MRLHELHHNVSHEAVSISVGGLGQLALWRGPTCCLTPFQRAGVLPAAWVLCVDSKAQVLARQLLSVAGHSICHLAPGRSLPLLAWQVDLAQHQGPVYLPWLGDAGRCTATRALVPIATAQVVG